MRRVLGLCLHWQCQNQLLHVDAIDLEQTVSCLRTPLTRLLVNSLAAPYGHMSHRGVHVAILGEHGRGFVSCVDVISQ